LAIFGISDLFDSGFIFTPACRPLMHGRTQSRRVSRVAAWLTSPLPDDPKLAHYGGLGHPQLPLQPPVCDLIPLQNMSDMTYYQPRLTKPLAWIQGAVKTPPFSAEARLETGMLLRRLQQGEKLTLPCSRPMPVIGRRCHELRIYDVGRSWRIIYRLDDDAIVILEVFTKKTDKTPRQIIETCKSRLRDYDNATE
jgi:phage-related protein